MKPIHRQAVLRAGIFAAAAACALSLATPQAFALEETNDEREALKGCEKKICDIIVKKEASGSDLACKLSKTWNKAKIQEGIEKKRLTWGFGNARCGVDVAIKRDEIVAAMTKPEHAIELAPQTVSCQIEREKEVTEIKVTLAPKLAFKAGKADKAWLNVKEIEAPAIIKGALWTAAQVEDRIGVFHSDMISEINEFIVQKCPKALTN